MNTSRQIRTLWFAIFVAGILLRSLLWSGYGLGDDGNYYPTYKTIFENGGIDLNHYFGFRFSLWIPVVLFMRLFGPESELGFIGFITFSSFVNLAVVYGLARQEWDRETGLLAMALMAVFPLDVTCATLFATDLPLSMYCFTAFWFFREALVPTGSARRSLTCAIVAGLLLFVAFLTKPWVLLIFPLFIAETFRHGRRALRVAFLTFGIAGLLVAAYQGWQWAVFGDLLYSINLERSETSAPYSVNMMLTYPRMLFTPNEYGGWFAGFYPHLLILGLAARLRGGSGVWRWAIYGLIMLIGLAALPVKYEKGVFFPLSPQIFRYLCLVSIPLVLAVTAAVRGTFFSKRRIFLAALAMWAVCHLILSVNLSAPTRDAFGDMRRAGEWLSAISDEKVWSDEAFIGRFAFFGLRSHRLDRIRRLKGETPLEWYKSFDSVDEGIVVTGGARLPWYGCLPCAANLSGYSPPETWSLIAEFPAPMTLYRCEPFRAWRVSGAAAQAREILGGTGGDSVKLLIALQDSLDSGRFSVAREIARSLIEAHPDLIEAYWGGGMGAYYSGRYEDAARWLGRGLNLDGGERFVIQLALTAWGKGDFDAARTWVKDFIVRYPDRALPAPLAEIACGLAEGFTRYHEGRCRTALRIFESIGKRADVEPPLQRRALYFQALCLFRMYRVKDAVMQTEKYLRSYSEDTDWIELQYRHAESLRRSDPSTARRLYEILIARFPETYWGREAAHRLSEPIR